MASIKAATVEEYLAELPPERRAVVAKVRDVVKKKMPKGYTETMNWGMICYEVPLSRYAETHNKQPLCYAGIAAQKNHYAVYLTGAYSDTSQAKRLKEEFKKAGKKLDMGKSCVRFRKVDDLSLDAIGKVIASTPPEKFIAQYESRKRR